MRIPLLLAATLAAATAACSVLSPAGPGPTVSATSGVTSTPTAGAGPAYTGQFDCYGSENGVNAYAGRITIQPSGVFTFKNYDNIAVTGAWTYDVSANTFTFTGGTPLASAVYKPANDAVRVEFTPGMQVVHAEGGSMYCQRAKPGITGPP